MRFSIILPTFNRAGHLNYAIESVIAQSFLDWELIIIDDGSTDNTFEIVEGYTKKDARIKYFYQKNQERSAARNNGISKSTGDFVLFLDSDDYVEIDHLKSINEWVRKDEAEFDFFFTSYKQRFEDEIVNGEVVNYNSNKSFLAYLIANPIATPRGVCKKEILEGNLFNESLSMGEDSELWSRISLVAKVKQIPVNTYILVHHDGRSVAAGLSVSLSHMETLKIISSLVKSKEEKESLQKAFSYSRFKIGDYYLRNNKRFLALWNYLRAFFIAPNFRTKEYFYKMYSALFKSSDTI